MYLEPDVQRKYGKYSSAFKHLHYRKAHLKEAGMKGG